MNPRLRRMLGFRPSIGGSDAAAVLGISPWKTPLELWQEKTGQALSSDEARNAKAKRRGKVLERYILDALVEDHGMTIIKRNRRWIDPTDHFLACEIDAETTSDENIEVKTVSPFHARDWGEEHSDSVPVHYTAQAMHGLMVTGRRICIFAVLIGDDLRLYRVERDDDLIRALREKEVRFWREHVETRTPPPPLNSSDIMRMFARDDGASIVADAALCDTVIALRRAKAEAKALAEEIEAHEERLKLALGAHTALIAEDGKPLCTWRAQTRRVLDGKALAAEHPEIAEQFMRTQETRVFRLT